MIQGAVGTAADLKAMAAGAMAVVMCAPAVASAQVEAAITFGTAAAEEIVNEELRYLDADGSVDVKLVKEAAFRNLSATRPDLVDKFIVLVCPVLIFTLVVFGGIGCSREAALSDPNVCGPYFIEANIISCAIR
jgi:hypothetical protein